MSSSTRTLVSLGIAAGCALAAVSFAAVGTAGSPTTRVEHSVDTGLCPFPLEITVTSKDQTHGVDMTVLKFQFVGPTTIKLRNRASTEKARSKQCW
jgi:hypothetical protein